jgi:hypothetical protein
MFDILKFIVVLLVVVALILVGNTADHQQKEIKSLNKTIDSLQTQILVLNHTDSNKVNEVQQKIAEYSFFEGQRSAINNDIRIAKDDSGYWVWTKSPNRDGKEPKFNLKWLGKDY